MECQCLGAVTANERGVGIGYARKPDGVRYKGTSALHGLPWGVVELLASAQDLFDITHHPSACGLWTAIGGFSVGDVGLPPGFFSG